MARGVRRARSGDDLVTHASGPCTSASPPRVCISAISAASPTRASRRSRCSATSSARVEAVLTGRGGGEGGSGLSQRCDMAVTWRGTKGRERGATGYPQSMHDLAANSHPTRTAPAQTLVPLHTCQSVLTPCEFGSEALVKVDATPRRRVQKQRG